MLRQTLSFVHTIIFKRVKSGNNNSNNKKTMHDTRTHTHISNMHLCMLYLENLMVLHLKLSIRLRMDIKHFRMCDTRAHAHQLILYAQPLAVQPNLHHTI